MAAAADDDEKSTFRCLDAARWVAAAVVMVVIVAVIGYAFKVVLRPSDLSLWITKGSVSVKRSHSNSSTTSTSSSSHELTFEYTVRAVNPSGRVWIYYTGITAKLKAINSTGEDNSLFILNLSDVALAPQSQMDTSFTKTTYAKYPYQEEYFEKLDNGTNIDRGWIELNGTRTVEAYSGYNTTVASSYYCSPIVIGGDDDDGTAVAVQLDAACNIMTNRSTRGG